MTNGFHVQLYADPLGRRVNWRLLSGNNRECGRGTGEFAGAEQCLAAVRELQLRVAGLTHRTRLVEGYRWRWELLIGDGSVAATSRAFDRLVRCEQGARQFLGEFAGARLKTAVVDPTVRRRRASAA